MGDQVTSRTWTFCHGTELLSPEAEFWDVVGTKVLRIFLLAIHSNSANGFVSYPPLSNSGLKLVCNVSENSQDYAQKPQRNCTFMNSASVEVTNSQDGAEQGIPCWTINLWTNIHEFLAFFWPNSKTIWRIYIAVSRDHPVKILCLFSRSLFKPFLNILQQL